MHNRIKIMKHSVALIAFQKSESNTAKRVRRVLGVLRTNPKESKCVAQRFTKIPSLHFLAPLRLCGEKFWATS